VGRDSMMTTRTDAKTRAGTDDDGRDDHIVDRRP
jgi:hypothetical protein